MTATPAAAHGHHSDPYLVLSFATIMFKIDAAMRRAESLSEPFSFTKPVLWRDYVPLTRLAVYNIISQQEQVSGWIV